MLSSVHSNLYAQNKPVRLLLGGLLGAVLTALLVVWYLGGERYKSELHIDFLPAKLKLVQGEGEEQADAIIIQSLTEQGLALLSSPRGFAFQTDQRDRFDWCLAGAEAALKLRLLWTLSAQPGQVHTADLNAQNGCHSFDLKPFENWFGLADGLGLQIEGQLHTPLTLTLSKVALRPTPPTALGLLRELWRDWTQHHSWQTSAVHFVKLGSLQALFPLSLLLIIWVLISSLIVWSLFSRTQRAPAGLMFGFAIAAWIAIDGLWQWELSHRVKESYHQLAAKSVTERLRYYDGELISLVDAVQALLPPTPQRLFILSDAQQRTNKLRAHYHLLPHNVNSQTDLPPSPNLARPGDYILILGRIQNLRYYDRRGKEALLWGEQNQFQLAVKPLLAEYNGVLFVVTDR